MNLIDALLGEHAILYAIFDRLEADLPGARSLEEVRASISILETTLLSHARVEDELLFPALEARIGAMGPLTVMRMEHREIEEGLKEAAGAVSKEAATARALQALGVARGHFSKEEQILFGIAREALAEEALLGMGEKWAALRKVSVAAAGSCCGH